MIAALKNFQDFCFVYRYKYLSLLYSPAPVQCDTVFLYFISIISVVCLFYAFYVIRIKMMNGMNQSTARTHVTIVLFWELVCTPSTHV